MDVVMLSRLQFAVTVFFPLHLCPADLGLVVLLAIMETLYVRTGNEVYKRMVKFWGKLFLINFVLGVVTGITLEFQFGTNWSRYSEYVATSSARCWPSKPRPPSSLSPPSLRCGRSAGSA